MEISAGGGTIRPVAGKLRSGVGRKPAVARRKKRRPGHRHANGPGGYIQATRSVGISLVLTLPLLVIYNVGELFPSSRMTNGLDLLTRLVGTQWGMYGVLIMNLVIGIVSLVLAFIMIKTARIRLWHWPVLVIEGIAWAFVLALLGYLLSNAMGREILPGAWLTPNSKYNVGQILTASAGAGYWEEVAFRLGMIGFPMWVATKFVEKKKGNLFVKVLFATAIMGVSAVSFSAVHYLGGNEKPEMWSFAFRAMSGLLFGLLFLFRGFSTAAYTHFVYDVIVFWNTTA